MRGALAQAAGQTGQQRGLRVPRRGTPDAIHDPFYGRTAAGNAAAKVVVGWRGAAHRHLQRACATVVARNLQHVRNVLRDFLHDAAGGATSAAYRGTRGRGRSTQRYAQATRCARPAWKVVSRGVWGEGAGVCVSMCVRNGSIGCFGALPPTDLGHAHHRIPGRCIAGRKEGSCNAKGAPHLAGQSSFTARRVRAARPTPLPL
jgi:hypothetical protein